MALCLSSLGKRHSPALWVLPGVSSSRKGCVGTAALWGTATCAKAVRRPQAAVFAQLAEVVDGVADGFDVAIFAYGQVCTTASAG